MRTFVKLTRVIAAFFARIVGRARSTLGAGGGRAATCGEAASGERFFAVGGLDDGVGTTTGGVSPNSGEEELAAGDFAAGGAGRS